MDSSRGPLTSGQVSRTAKLQEKVRLLEEQVKCAEQAELESSRKTAAILGGKMDIVPAALDPLIACYPTPHIDHDLPPFLDWNPVKIGCVSAIPRAVIHKKLHDWDQTQETSVELRRLLLSIFLPHRDQFNFDLGLERFEARLLLPSTDPDALHPCLVNAVALAACSCAGSDLRAFETVFLERTQRECERSLENADRLEHFLWSSVIVGWYWTRVGKILNAHSVSTTVAHWAIACDLHCIPDPERYVQCGDYGLLGPLRDIVHFAERVNLWWAIFLLDRRVALATGLPPSIREECRIVTTVWPRSCEQMKINSSPSAWGRESINDLFLHGSQCIDVANDSLLCLRAKSCALLDRAMWVAHLAKNRSPTDAFWTVYISIDNALDQVLKTMPDITDQREIEDGEPGKRLNPSLVLARSYVHSAVIVLHSVESENNALAYERCLAASRSMARDVELVGDVSFIYAHACLGVTWVNGAEVCAREFQRLSPPRSLQDEVKLRNVQKDLDAYTRGLAWLTSHFPRLITYIHRIGALLHPQDDTPTETTIPREPVTLPVM